MKFQSFQEFYPYYLTQHSDINCRRLHVVGSALALIFALRFLFTFHLSALIAIPICAYGFAWIGHAVFEKNKPATFEYPLFSLMGDVMMMKDIAMGKVKIM